MGEMTFDFPPELHRWIEMRLAGGRYADVADYLRDLIRRDQDGLLPETSEDIAWVRERVAEGFASGRVEAEPENVLEEIIVELSDEDD